MGKTGLRPRPAGTWQPWKVVDHGPDDSLIGCHFPKRAGDAVCACVIRDHKTPPKLYALAQRFLEQSRKVPQLPNEPIDRNAAAIINRTTILDCEHGYSELVEFGNGRIALREHDGDRWFDHEPYSVFRFCRHPKQVDQTIRHHANKNDPIACDLTVRLLAQNPAVRQLPPG